MSPRNTIRDWARLLYYLSQNAISLIGVVLTTNSAVTLIAICIYDFILPGPPHPYVGILLVLILPALFFLGLVLIPIGILLHRRTLRAAGELPQPIPAVDLEMLRVRNTFLSISFATLLNILIFTFASYQGVP
jgi:hypothetical protein